MNKFLPLLPLGLVLLLVACGDSLTGGGDDQVATQCLAFSQATKKGNQFRHKVHNTCKKNIQVLDSASEQRFTILGHRDVVVNLSSATPSLGACYAPYIPEIKSADQFKCRK